MANNIHSNFMKNIVLLWLCYLSVFGVQAQGLYFPPNFSEEWETADISQLNWCEEKLADLDVFLKESNTNAFIILKDGKIAHEAYFNEFDVTSSWYWASAGKTITASMIGILQEEGALNINDPTSMYLGEGWTSCTSGDEGKITIRNQLTMTTGLDFNTNDVYCIDPECLLCLNEPGEEWFYHNAPYTLLSYLMEAALGQGYTAMTNAKLVNKIGFIGLWTVSESGRLFFSTARGMARYGLLMLNGGDWDGEVIINDKEYFQDMITPSQDINKAYGYLWRLNGQDTYRLPGSTFTFQGKIIPNAPDDLYAAIGKNGQIAMVVPSQNIVIVRMGNNPDSSLVPLQYVRDIWDEYTKLDCSVAVKTTDEIEFSVRPKLVLDKIEIISGERFDKINVYNMNGLKLISGSSRMLDLSEMSRGIYLIEVTQGNRRTIKRIVKL